MRDIIAAGHSVYAFIPSYDDKVLGILEELGLTPVNKTDRTSLNQLGELEVVRTLIKLLNEQKLALFFHTL